MTGNELLRQLLLMQENNPDLLNLEMFCVYNNRKKLVKCAYDLRFGKMTAKYKSTQFGEQIITPEKVVQLNNIKDFNYSTISIKIDNIHKVDYANVLII